MSSLKASAAVLAMAIGASGWAVESPPVSDDRGSERMDLQSTWWSAENDANLIFTWSQPEESRELLLTWWQPTTSSALLFAFSSPEENRDLAFAWSRPDESRELLFTWSHGSGGEAAGSASGEPSVR